MKWLRSLPIDLGQEEVRYRTRAKEIALALAGEGAGRQALDLGCHDGFWSERLRSRGWDVVKMDGEPKCPDGIKVDFNRPLPFSGGSFDFVMSLEVIAYLEDPAFFVSEILRVLRPEGRYVVTTPNTGFWLDAVLRLCGTSLKKLQDPRQRHFFTLSRIRELFPRSELHGYFPYTFYKATITRAVGFLSPTFVVHGAKT